MTTQPNTPGMTAAHSPAYEKLAFEKRAYETHGDLLRDARRGEVRMPPLATGPSAPRLQDDTRLPSSWYRPSAAPKANFTYDMLRAAALGLAAGLVVLAPLLWYNRAKPSALDRHSAPLGLTLASHTVDVAASTRLTPADRMRAIIELARLRIIVGDIVAARTILSRADVARDADALFLMAETYDPHMLSGWGARDVVADSGRARALYAAANALGHSQADERLAALQ